MTEVTTRYIRYNMITVLKTLLNRKLLIPLILTTLYTISTYYTYNKGYSSGVSSVEVVVHQERAKLAEESLQLLQRELDTLSKTNVIKDVSISKLKDDLKQSSYKFTTIQEELYAIQDNDEGNMCDTIPDEYYSLYQRILSSD